MDLMAIRTLFGIARTFDTSAFAVRNMYKRIASIDGPCATGTSTAGRSEGTMVPEMD